MDEKRLLTLLKHALKLIDLKDKPSERFVKKVKREIEKIEGPVLPMMDYSLKLLINDGTYNLFQIDKNHTGNPDIKYILIVHGIQVYLDEDGRNILPISWNHIERIKQIAVERPIIDMSGWEKPADENNEKEPFTKGYITLHGNKNNN